MANKGGRKGSHKGRINIKNEGPPGGSQRATRLSSANGESSRVLRGRSLRSSQGLGGEGDVTSTDTDEEILRIKRKLLARSQHMKSSLRGLDRQIEEIGKLQALRDMTCEANIDSSEGSVVEVMEVESSDSVVEISSDARNGRQAEMSATKEEKTRKMATDDISLVTDSTGHDTSEDSRRRKVPIRRSGRGTQPQRGSNSEVEHASKGDVDHESGMMHGRTTRAKGVTSGGNQEQSEDVLKMETLRTCSQASKGSKSGNRSGGAEITEVKKKLLSLDDHLCTEAARISQKPSSRSCGEQSAAKEESLKDEEVKSITVIPEPEILVISSEDCSEIPEGKGDFKVKSPGASQFTGKKASQKTQPQCSRSGPKTLELIKPEEISTECSNQQSFRRSHRQGLLQSSSTQCQNMEKEASQNIVVVEITSDSQTESSVDKKVPPNRSTPVRRESARKTRTRCRSSGTDSDKMPIESAQSSVLSDGQRGKARNQEVTRVRSCRRNSRSTVRKEETGNLPENVPVSPHAKISLAEAEEHEEDAGSSLLTGIASVNYSNIQGIENQSEEHVSSLIDQDASEETVDNRRKGDKVPDVARRKVSSTEGGQDNTEGRRTSIDDTAIKEQRPQATSKKRFSNRLQEVAGDMDLAKGERTGSRTDGYVEYRSRTPSWSIRKSGSKSEDCSGTVVKPESVMETNDLDKKYIPRSPVDANTIEGKQKNVAEEVRQVGSGLNTQGSNLEESCKSPNSSKGKKVDQRMEMGSNCEGHSRKNADPGRMRQNSDGKRAPRRSTRGAKQDLGAGDKAGSTTESDTQETARGGRARRKPRKKYKLDQSTGLLGGHQSIPVRVFGRKRTRLDDQGNEGDVESEVDASGPKRSKRQRKSKNGSKLNKISHRSEEAVTASSSLSTEEEELGNATHERSKISPKASSSGTQERIDSKLAYGVAAGEGKVETMTIERTHVFAQHLDEGSSLETEMLGLSDKLKYTEETEVQEKVTNSMDSKGQVEETTLPKITDVSFAEMSAQDYSESKEVMNSTSVHERSMASRIDQDDGQGESLVLTKTKNLRKTGRMPEGDEVGGKNIENSLTLAIVPGSGQGDGLLSPRGRSRREVCANTEGDDDDGDNEEKTNCISPQDMSSDKQEKRIMSPRARSLRGTARISHMQEETNIDTSVQENNEATAGGIGSSEEDIRNSGDCSDEGKSRGVTRNVSEESNLVGQKEKIMSPRTRSIREAARIPDVQEEHDGGGRENMKTHTCEQERNVAAASEQEDKQAAGLISPSTSGKRNAATSIKKDDNVERSVIKTGALTQGRSSVATEPKEGNGMMSPSTRRSGRITRNNRALADSNSEGHEMVNSVGITGENSAPNSNTIDAYKVSPRTRRGRGAIVQEENILTDEEDEQEQLVMSPKTEKNGESARKSEVQEESSGDRGKDIAVRERDLAVVSIQDNEPEIKIVSPSRNRRKILRNSEGLESCYNERTEEFRKSEEELTSASNEPGEDMVSPRTLTKSARNSDSQEDGCKEKNKQTTMQEKRTPPPSSSDNEGGDILSPRTRTRRKTAKISQEQGHTEEKSEKVESRENILPTIDELSNEQEAMSPRTRGDGKGGRLSGREGSHPDERNKHVTGDTSMREVTSPSATKQDSGDVMLPPRTRRRRKIPARYRTSEQEQSDPEENYDISDQKVTSSTSKRKRNITSTNESGTEGHNKTSLGKARRQRGATEVSSLQDDEDGDIDSCEVTSSTPAGRGDCSTSGGRQVRGRRGRRSKILSTEEKGEEEGIKEDDGRDDDEKDPLHHAETMTAEGVLASLKLHERGMFKDALEAAEEGLKTDTYFTCPSCKVRRVMSLPGLVTHLKYKCETFSYVKTKSTLKDERKDELKRLGWNRVTKKFRNGRAKCPQPDCNRYFTTLQGYRYHQVRCGKEPTFEYACEHCGKKYASQPGLAHHLRNYHQPVSHSQEPEKEKEVPLGRRSAATKAIQKLHEIADDIGEDSPVSIDVDTIKDMSNSKRVKALYQSPEAYTPSQSQIESWQEEKRAHCRMTCTFCRSQFVSLYYMRQHAVTCHQRHSSDPFICLTCKEEQTTKKMMFRHLLKQHRKLVEEAMREDEESEPEPDDDDGQSESDQDDDDLSEGEQNERKATSQKRPETREVGCSIKATREFRSMLYCPEGETLFDEWMVNIAEWEKLTESDASRYHPQTKVSPVFRAERRQGLAKVESITPCQTLPLYGAMQDGDGAIFFTGGPVHAMAWCPLPETPTETHEYVAVCCHPDMNYFHFFSETDPSPSLIQVWRLGATEMVKHTPQMVLGIAHDYGITNAIAWCPSGAYQPPTQEGSPRLGLLAMACATGMVVICAVPHPDEDRPLSVYKLAPCLKLLPTRGDRVRFGQCLCVYWSKSKGHSKIAAGFGNGMVGIWNLNITSKLVSGVENGIPCRYPTQVLYIGNVSVSSVCMNATDDCFLTAVGTNRYIALWDTRFPDAPLNELCTCTGLDCDWLLFYREVMVATESISFRSRGCSVFPFDTGVRTLVRTIPLRSGIWSFSISDWLNCIAAGSENGQVAINRSIFSTRLHSQRLLTNITVDEIPPTFEQPSDILSDTTGNIVIGASPQTASTKGRQCSMDTDHGPEVPSNPPVVCEGNSTSQDPNLSEKDSHSSRQHGELTTGPDSERRFNAGASEGGQGDGAAVAGVGQPEVGEGGKADQGESQRQDDGECRQEGVKTILAPRMSNPPDLRLAGGLGIAPSGESSSPGTLKETGNAFLGSPEGENVRTAEMTSEAINHFENAINVDAKDRGDELIQALINDPSQGVPLDAVRDEGQKSHIDDSVPTTDVHPEGCGSKPKENDEGGDDPSELGDIIDRLMKACQNKLQHLDEGVASDEDAAERVPEVRKHIRYYRKKGCDESSNPPPPDRAPCIMDKDFDIRQVLKNDESMQTEHAGVDREVDVTELRSKIRGRKETYEHAASFRCVVYTDFLEPKYQSKSWKEASDELMAIQQDVAPPTTEYALNAVTKVVWSPNFHSRCWLLVAGQNGIVRMLNVNYKAI